MQKSSERSERRNKRVPAPFTRSEFVGLRNYAARKRLPMSQVLLELVKRDVQSICDGADPLPEIQTSATA